MTDPLYWQYMREKWVFKKQKELEGEYSKEVREYLVEYKLEDTFDCLKYLIGYCLNPEDERKKRKFEKYLLAFVSEYENLLEAIEVLKKDDYKLWSFLSDALRFFRNERGESIYPGHETAYLLLESLTGVLPEYRDMLTDVYLSKPDEKRERSFKAYLEIYESALVSEDPRATEKLQNMMTEFVYRMYKTEFEDAPPQARCIELERLGKKYLDNQYFYNALSLLKKEHCGFVLVEQEKAPDYEKIVGRKVLQAGMKRGAAQRTEKERKQKECYALYDKMMSDDHWLKSETKIKKEIAKKMHCAVKTITRYLLERTE